MVVNINTAKKLDSPHILVVDDDPVLLGITRQVVEHLGYQVTIAKGSNEAITKIKEHPNTFDAVVTDYTLPIINGIELAKMIKELSADIPVVLYSGKIDLIDRKQIASARIAALAGKPCSMDELDLIIKRVVYGNAEVCI